MYNQSKIENVNFIELPPTVRSVHSKLTRKPQKESQKKQLEIGLPSYIDHVEENIKTGFKTGYNFIDIIGESSQMDHARKLAQRFAASSANILFIGESGTGKELFAQAIHNQSRPSGPFMVLNCAAIPRNLIESELFGYDGGAYTGANKSGSKGKIELAEQGTLFLDEIGDMPLETQAVLLRVLENKQVMRVGGKKYRQIDFRLIAATNKDLQLMVNDGLFRLDLFYRLSVLTVHIPPLRQRERDIITLAKFFLKKYCSAVSKIPEINIETKLKLMEYNWPGNVRQLENAMIYAANVIDTDVILPEHLPIEISNYNIGQQKRYDSALERLNEVVSRKEAEKIVIQNALAKADNNIALAADLLGIGKTTLYRRLKFFKAQKVNME